jgi:hypothetical protein
MANRRRQLRDRKAKKERRMALIANRCMKRMADTVSPWYGSLLILQKEQKEIHKEKLMNKLVWEREIHKNDARNREITEKTTYREWLLSLSEKEFTEFAITQRLLGTSEETINILINARKGVASEPTLTGWTGKERRPC